MITNIMNIRVFLVSVYYYLKYKKKPKFSFFIIKYKNGTSEIVLFKNAYKYRNTINNYHMFTFNKIHKDGMDYNLEDWSKNFDKLIPVWTFKELYNFLKLVKERQEDMYLYEHSIIVRTDNIKKTIKNLTKANVCKL